MVSEHVEQREGVYYVPETRISLDSIVYAFAKDARQSADLGGFQSG